MKLYNVTYYTWNCTFSNLNLRHMLAVGSSADDAILRVKERVDEDARDFSAEEIDNVMGYRIQVGAPA